MYMYSYEGLFLVAFSLFSIFEVLAILAIIGFHLTFSLDVDHITFYAEHTTGV